MSILIKCQICGSDGRINYGISQMRDECMIECTNTDCRNSKMRVRFQDWQSIPINDHPLKDEIMELVRSGKAKIS